MRKGCETNSKQNDIIAAIVRMIGGVSAAGMMILLAMSASVTVKAASDEVYYYSKAEKKDSGYSTTREMKSNDDHSGWELGKLCIRGYSDVLTSDDCPVFLKNIGDEISMSFLLEQDINALNGDKRLSVAEDADGYDAHFGIPKGKKDVNFKKGALLIKHTDYRNSTEYVHYVDYLTGVRKGAETSVYLFEEGDYEVALDYEIVKDGPLFINTRDNYQILFKFSVRDGECMADLMDVGTGSDLLDGDTTGNGFSIDLAGSKYLGVYVKKYILSGSQNSFTIMDEKSAHDGDTFKDEGIYDVIVSNRYTGQETTKRIYVGNDPVIMAYLNTGVTLSDVRKVYEYLKNLR